SASCDLLRAPSHPPHGPLQGAAHRLELQPPPAGAHVLIRANQIEHTGTAPIAPLHQALHVGDAALGPSAWPRLTHHQHFYRYGAGGKPPDDSSSARRYLSARIGEVKS